MNQRVNVSEEATMMGIQENQGRLFDYHVNLDQRVRPDHPLRRLAAVLDLSFVRETGAATYGSNGTDSVNATHAAATDPAATLVRRHGQSQPCYKHHRVVDDAQGVITAVATTTGVAADGGQLPALVAQHETNTGARAQTVVGDRHYGT